MAELSESEEVEQLIEKLVTSGEQKLNETRMKRLKSLCKISCLEQAFHILMTQLQKDHCEIRYSTFQIIDQLFLRSHQFRTMLLDKFSLFMELTVETDFDNPLPPPKPVANKLKEESLKAIRAWNDKYGIAYQKLSLGFDYLKNVKMVNFDQPLPTGRSVASENRLSRMKIVNGLKLDKLKQEIDSSLWEIKCFVVEMNNCLNLIIPNFNDDNDILFEDSEIEKNPDSPPEEEPKETGLLSSLREAGVTERGYSIQLNLTEVASMNVVENADNTALLGRAKDLIKSASRLHLPKLKDWLGAAGTYGAPPELIKDLIDVKGSINSALEKYYEMNIVPDDDDEDCDDFVEVPEEFVPSISKPKEEPSEKKLDAPLGNSSANSSKDTNIWNPLRKDDNLNDPTTYKYALAKQAEKLQKSEENSEPNKMKKLFPKPKKRNTESNLASSSLKEKAPVVPFGRDLLTWDEEKYQELKRNLTFGAHQELDLGHRFYGGHSASQADSGASEAALSSITSRTIEFSGEFQPVFKMCLAPLPNGTLCQRRDRFKCPFHGKIVDRDACGKAKNEPSTSTGTSSAAEWNDPEYLNDLQKSLPAGVDLKKKKRGKKKVENGLTNLKKIKNTSRTRLQRKVLSKGSLKRVSETLNQLDAKRNLDKFGNNFNYALN